MRYAAVVVTALLGFGCSGDSAGPNDPSSFSGGLTGSYTASLEGPSWFGQIVHAGGPRVFTLRMYTDDDLDAFLELSSGRFGMPSQGAHEIVPLADGEDPDDFRGRFTFTVPDGFLQECDVRGGTLRVTAAAPTQVEGEFELRCVTRFETHQGPAGDLFVTGQFIARHLGEVSE